MHLKRTHLRIEALSLPGHQWLQSQHPLTHTREGLAAICRGKEGEMKEKEVRKER